MPATGQASILRNGESSISPITMRATSSLRWGLLQTSRAASVSNSEVRSRLNICHVSTLWKFFKAKSKKPIFFWDYYQEEFFRLHGQLGLSGYRFGHAAAESQQFWDVVPDGRYDSTRGIELVDAFATRVEDQPGRMAGLNVCALRFRCHFCNCGSCVR